MKLHIGGTTPHPDWKILDIEARPEVDYIGDANDLSQFEDESIEAIYASHVLEHFYYRLYDELIFTLAEWYRVLKPEGKLMISVPDLFTLCSLYLTPHLTVDDRFILMTAIFGGQLNPYDVHKVGFDEEILAIYLRDVGFESYQRVEEFELFSDSSSLRVMGHLISLNMIAYKTCPT
ncbi:Methyltransferase domain-containing protein [Tumidithrix helvetica PCC 7403]|uniref:class I SAM-dependent methyltransferase n=1 Tax=Tumidithrix helvetica TaxID=3457545 RepID=UPI003CA8E78F